MDAGEGLRKAVTAEGVYLLRLDDEGGEITDTWHESVDDAFEQARFEFGIPKESWDDPS